LDLIENRNNNEGVNGLLIYSNGNFFEVIEGEKNKIMDLFEDIKQDLRYRNIMIIFEKVAARPFGFDLTF
jgi:hypothetical protein